MLLLFDTLINNPQKQDGHDGILLATAPKFSENPHLAVYMLPPNMIEFADRCSG